MNGSNNNQNESQNMNDTKVEASVNAIKQLKMMHKMQWKKFNGMIETAVKGMGLFGTESDMTEATAADFVKAGFSQEQADALIFVLTEDCMGQPVINAEMIDRWFSYTA